MKNGIGPQNLGATGMNPKSKPCGTPLDFNEKLRSEVGKGTLNPGFEKAIKDNDPALNMGTPLPFQDDISKIQEAASTLEAHNIGGGGGGAAAAPTGDVRAQQASIAADSMGGGNAPGTGSATLGGALGGRFTKGNLGRLLAGAKRPV